MGPVFIQNYCLKNQDWLPHLSKWILQQIKCWFGLHQTIHRTLPILVFSPFIRLCESFPYQTITQQVLSICRLFFGLSNLTCINIPFKCLINKMSQNANVERYTNCLLSGDYTISLILLIWRNRNTRLE
jgi:hypothetical protein